MALGNYGDLAAAIPDFLQRDDLSAATIATFVSLAEARIRRDVRHRLMDERSTATLTGRYMPLPEDWVETIRLTVNTSEGERALQLVSHAGMQQMREREDQAGQPRYYAHVGDEIEIYPTPDSPTAEIYYRASIPPLDPDDDASTNWLLDQAPDVYLHASLLHTAPYLSEDSRLNTWAALYSEAVDALNAAGMRAEASTGTMRMRLNHV